MSPTGGSDRFVGQLLKYDGKGMVLLLEKLFSVIWREEVVPRQWTGGLSKICLRRVIGSSQGIIEGFLSVVGNVFCKCSLKCPDGNICIHTFRVGIKGGTGNGEWEMRKCGNTRSVGQLTV